MKRILLTLAILLTPVLALAQNNKIMVADAVIPLSDSCKAAFFELLSHKSILLKAEPLVREFVEAPARGEGKEVFYSK